MKIIINYDLIDKIKEAKTGFSLIRSTKRVLLKTTFSQMFFIIFDLLLHDSFNNTIKEIPYSLIIYLIIFSLFELPYKNIRKINALNDIKKLVSLLKDLNICTDKELLMDSYIYEKEHKLINNENEVLPKISEKKYIMVPVYNNGEIKEVSLLQEHIIGSKYYVISYGEPTKQKVFRSAFGSI